MKTMLNYIFLFGLLTFSSQSPGQNANYKISGIPGWVEAINPSYETSGNNDSNSGFIYLLVNRQRKVENEQKFINNSIKILNSEGLQELSDLKIDFDPNYQELVFHKINVVRGEKVINQLDHSSIRLLQRETSMDRHIYDGRLTAVINLRDIRVGDIIDYAYSIIGNNPVYEGKYYDKIYLQYSIPIEHLYIRLIIPNEKKLQFKYNNGTSKPVHHQSNDGHIYIWEQKNVAIILYDINTPLWYDPYPNVSISEYSSWEDVVEWGLALYSSNEWEKNQLTERVKDIIDHPSIDSTIMRAIRFTQDEIRFLGFENGLNSHKPHLPTKVLDQRYGDCKDKSFLLSEILKAYGIDASPVLVHSGKGYSIEENLPSPVVFDHCVVQLVKDGKTYFIDPTISNQGGDLERNYFPDYHKGLIIRKGEKALTDLPLSTYSSIRVSETFTLDEVEEGARLHVLTTYTGMEADYQREYFAGVNTESVQKTYIDFYSRLYPQIRIDGNIKVTDNRGGSNRLIVEEFYVVDSIWFQSEYYEEELLCEFNPLLLASYVSGEKSPKRSMPYYVHFPLDIEHEMIIKLPEDWSIENESQKIESESFSYNFSVNYRDDKLKIVHQYKTHNSYINADMVESFVKDHNTIQDNLSYILMYNKNLAGAEFRFSWFMGTIALITLILCSFGAVKIFNNYDIPVSSDPGEQREIGGWLILVAIGLSVTPFWLLYDFLQSPEYFNRNVWNVLVNIDTSTRNLLSGLLMFIELLYYVIFFVFSLLVMFLFYNKRTIFPRFVILLYLVQLIFLIIDTAAALNINPDAYTEVDKQTFFREIVRSFVSAAIWIPYFLLSKRVKQTFVRQSRKNSGEIWFESQNINKQPFSIADYSRPNYWLLVWTGVFVSIITISFFIANGSDANGEKANISSDVYLQDPPLPSIGIPEDISYRVDSSEEWKYAILQCVSKDKNEIRIRIITLNDYSSAEEALSKLKRGVEFPVLASQESNHPTKSDGGDLGTINISDLDEQFRAALINIAEGEHTGIIEMGTD